MFGRDARVWRLATEHQHKLNKQQREEAMAKGERFWTMKLRSRPKSNNRAHFVFVFVFQTTTTTTTTRRAPPPLHRYNPSASGRPIYKPITTDSCPWPKNVLPKITCAR
jgi:hypothetical protein